MLDAPWTDDLCVISARGTGKSSLVKAMLAQYANAGLRLIEVDKSDLPDLSEIVEQVKVANDIVGMVRQPECWKDEKVV